MNNKLKKPSPDYLYEILAWQDFADDELDLQVLTDARAIAAEWVTPTRLEHVIDRFKRGFRPGRTDQLTVYIHAMSKAHTGTVVEMMIEDVIREGTGEIVDSLPMRKEVGKAAAVLFLKSLEEK